MIFLFISCAFSAKYFELKQTLWPPTDNELGLFGRAISFSRDRIAVGAEYLKIDGFKIPDDPENEDRIGGVYVYDYNPSTGSYTISPGNNETFKRIQPQKDSKYPNVIPGTFSSRLLLSDDGQRLIVGAPYTYVPTSLRDFKIYDATWNVKQDDDTVVSDGVEYYREIGAIYEYIRQDDGSWLQNGISIPSTIIYRGGYGRAIAGSSDLSIYAGSYYNKFRSSVRKVGGVNTETFGSNINNQRYISPPATINDAEKQRFGSTLDFYGTDSLYVTTTTQNSGGLSGVFPYTYRNNDWQAQDEITCNGADDYEYFGMSTTFRIKQDDALIALYASNHKTDKSNAIFILARGDGNLWSKTPQQIIQLGNESISDMFFCSAGENNFLSVLFGSEDSIYIKIYQQNAATKQYEIFQTIYDPKISYPGTTVSYEEQYIIFASDFDWDSEQCSKFIVGAMSKSGKGMETKPKPYSRVYVYELTTKEDGSHSKVGIIIGCVVAVVAIIAVVIFVVIMIRKKDGTVQIQ
ncbi:hypothetical protein GPJ56_005081 [Histomonas meleagridis]|uniref:uncharacterized protein n=1 Tax=Histomonas meleagridis TaxID=135588 RepID=UPI003559A08F|nr:hypothetical protein GPJ56_005081 [Histomonas meleagridis]KAH0802598.1 hypothetical protein GO595_004647 [Histomonas meleagridis]